MYSRNYGRGDVQANITPPPAYSGSAIQGGCACGAEEEKREPAPFSAFSQSIPLQKPQEGAKEPTEACKAEDCADAACATCERPAPEKATKSRPAFLSGLLDGIEASDLVLLGIIAALAFDLADKDVLLVALVIAAVLM
jgi:hypothetical protein